jgi:hypothetical protein
MGRNYDFCSFKFFNLFQRQEEAEEKHKEKMGFRNRKIIGRLLSCNSRANAYRKNLIDALIMKSKRERLSNFFYFLLLYKPPDLSVLLQNKLQ